MMLLYVCVVLEGFFSFFFFKSCSAAGVVFVISDFSMVNLEVLISCIGLEYICSHTFVHMLPW